MNKQKAAGTSLDAQQEAPKATIARLAQVVQQAVAPDTGVVLLLIPAGAVMGDLVQVEYLANIDNELAMKAMISTVRSLKAAEERAVQEAAAAGPV